MNDFRETFRRLLDRLSFRREKVEPAYSRHGDLPQHLQAQPWIRRGRGTPDRYGWKRADTVQDLFSACPWRSPSRESLNRPVRSLANTSPAPRRRELARFGGRV